MIKKKKIIFIFFIILIAITAILFVLMGNKNKDKEVLNLNNKATKEDHHIQNLAVNAEISKNNKIDKKENNQNTQKKIGEKLFLDYKNAGDEKEKMALLNNMIKFFKDKNNVIKYWNDLYDLIFFEQDPIFKRELVHLFFDNFFSHNFPKVDSKTEAEIKNAVKELIRDSDTRKYAISKIDIVLDKKEIEKFYSEIKNDLNEKEKEILINRFVNASILNKYNPLESTIKDDVEKYMNKDEIINRIIYFMADSDFLTQNNREETKKMIDRLKNNELAENILLKKIDYTKDQSYAFALFKAKYLILEDSKKGDFLKEEIAKLSNKQLKDLINMYPNLFNEKVINNLDTKTKNIINSTKIENVRNELNIVINLIKARHAISLDDLNYIERSSFIVKANFIKNSILDKNVKEKVINFIENSSLDDFEQQFLKKSLGIVEN